MFTKEKKIPGQKGGKGAGPPGPTPKSAPVLGLVSRLEIEEGVTASTDNTLRDLRNSLYDTKAEFNNCFIIHSK